MRIFNCNSKLSEKLQLFCCELNDTRQIKFCYSLTKKKQKKTTKSVTEDIKLFYK